MMATALHPGIENDPQHQKEAARRIEQKREQAYAMILIGFWGGLVLGLVATAGLLGTYLLYYM